MRLMSLVLIVGHDFNTHACDAVVFDFENQESATAINDGLFLFWEIAFYGKQHTGEGFGIFGHFDIVVLVEFGHAEEVGEKSSTFEDIRVVGQTLVGFFLVVILVVDVANDFFENVFKGYDALCAAKLVDNDSHVNFAVAEVFEQIINHSSLGNEVWLTDECSPIKVVGGCAHIGQQVAAI